MIKDLFIHNIKENKVLVIAFTMFVMIYVATSVGMYDPNSNEAMEAMMQLLPESMVNMFGFGDLTGSMVRYLSNYLYGFIMLMIPMIYTVMVGTKLVSKHVDRGSMIYLVTMPYTRKKIALTQAVFYILSFTVILLVNVLVLIIMSVTMFPGLLDIGLFLMINFVTLSVHLFLSSIAFLVSVLVGDSTRSLGISGGILFTFVILHMVSGLGESTEFLKYLTPFSLVNVDYILEGSGNGLLSGFIMLTLTGLIYYGAIQLFDRKSLII